MSRRASAGAVRAAANRSRCASSPSISISTRPISLRWSTGSKTSGSSQRQADADDRRIKRLVITEKGVHLSDEIIDAVFADGTVFDALDADEQRQLLHLLGKMVESPPTS